MIHRDIGFSGGIDIEEAHLVTLCILYHFPDYPSLLQEFSWQFEDLMPQFPRTKKFVLHWQNNVKAKIFEIKFGIIKSRNARDNYQTIEIPIDRVLH